MNPASIDSSKHSAPSPVGHGAPHITRLATVTSKGQLTLPVAICRRWGIGPGDKVALSVRSGAIAVRPLRRSVSNAKRKGVTSP